MKFIDELKQRNVIRVAIAYTIVAWVLLQGVGFILDIILAPEWVLQVFVLAAVIGLPVVMIFSWVFEITPDGIKLESAIDHNKPVDIGAGRKLDRTIIVFLVLAVALLLVDRNRGTGELLGPEKESATVQHSESGNEATSATQTPLSKPITSSKPSTSSNPGTSSEIPEDERSVAVLPFLNLSSDQEQEYLSDGLAEELLNRLAQYQRLRVAARTSSFQFKDKNEDISVIAEKLKVAYVLEGSIRKSGDRLRITAQLIKASDGYQVWAHTFERKMDDIFAIQDDISSAIINELEATFGAVPHQAAQSPTKSLPAYQLYLQARFALEKRGTDNLLRATELFEQALELDPNFAHAWSGLAFTYSILPGYSIGFATNGSIDQARHAINKTLELDPQNAEAYASLARIQNRFTAELVDARLNFKKAMELAPNNADIANLYGDYFTSIGDFKNAEIMERKAILLDPLAAVNYSELAFLYLTLHRYDDALANARVAAELSPDLFNQQSALINALIVTGDFEAAKELIEYARDELGASDNSVTQWWSLYFYYSGDVGGLRDTMDQRILESESEGAQISNFISAFYAMALDGTTAALPYLKASREANEFLLAWPDYFYLPEQVSNEPEWLEFWQQPGLKETMDMRRQFKSVDPVGLWKGQLK